MRERPQLDGLCASQQSVGQVPQAQKTGRASEQEPARTRIAVHLPLDGQQQLLDPLDLIDHQQAVIPDESTRIRLRSGTDRLVVQVQLSRASGPSDDQLRQGALTDLPIRGRSADHPAGNLPPGQ